MNLDGARNAQIEILRFLFEFAENRAYGDGPQAYVDPEFEDLAQQFGDPTEVLIASGEGVKSTLSRTSPRVARVRFTPTVSKPTNSIAIGVSASANKRKSHQLLAIYQDRELRKDPLLGQLHDRYKNEIRIIYAGRPRAFPAWHYEAVDPLHPGASLGHRSITAGTLGCFVRERKSGRLGVLSNNHILANVNSAQVGDPIYQPSPGDGGTAAHAIANLAAYTQIFFAGIPNTADCAWAELIDARQYNPTSITDSAGLTVASISTTTPTSLMPLDRVIKIGRTTGYTQGEVTAILTANLMVRMGSRLTARFDDVVQIESLNRNRFSDGGDSGSVVLTHDGKPGGLLFAGSKTGGSGRQGITFANPLDIVLNALNLDLVI